MRKPIKVFYSSLSGRFYATQHYKKQGNGYVITGHKDDVTNDIGAAVTEHEIEFTLVTPKKKEEKKGIRIQRHPGDIVKTKSSI